MRMYDVAVVGSGVIGMSIAKALDGYGLKIAVVDRDEPGKHASYKAGGMLGAQNEFNEDGALFRLALASRNRFEALSRAFLEEHDLDIEFRQGGLIKMAADDDGIPDLESQYQFLNSHDPRVQKLTGPALDSLTQGSIVYRNLSIHIPDDGQVNAWKYTRALLASVVTKGIKRFSRTEVHQVSKRFGSYTLMTSAGDIHADKVIVAGGAWSGKLLEGYGISSMISGVKGEVLLVEHEGLNLDQTVFMTNGCYIVPKNKDRFLIGATSYFDDFSVGVSDVGTEWLKTQATATIPALAESRLLKKWSGVRPYTVREQPIMDELDNGLFVITGHYRNGILLSPLIGDLVADWIVKNQRPELLRPFQVTRGGVGNGM